METRTQQTEKKRAALGDLCFYFTYIVSKWEYMVFEFFFFFLLFFSPSGGQLTLHLPHISSIPKMHGAPRKIPQMNWPIIITKSKSLLSRRFSNPINLHMLEKNKTKNPSRLKVEFVGGGKGIYINVRISPFIAHRRANRASTIPTVKMDFAAVSNGTPSVSTRNHF